MTMSRESRLRGATAIALLTLAGGAEAHSSIVNTLRLLEMDALVVDTADHRLTADTVRDVVPADAANICIVNI